MRAITIGELTPHATKVVIEDYDPHPAIKAPVAV